ncbi:MAG TPA: RIO1 family regulatory kinase/ATPase [Trebonia sp.]|nr:RIO1 family regulatory kinase/ATPase [Trebonia sp.]
MRDSADSYDPAYGRVRRAGKRQRKHFDDEQTFTKRDRHLQRLGAESADDATDGLPEGNRWSTWDQSTPTERGPRPHPKWLVTELAAVDTELGILKTGKEADVYLLRRAVPGTQRSCLLAAKRYRDAEHRLFHRDAGYLEGRRTRDSRVSRAAAHRTAFGKLAIAGQWANAEFAALCQLHNAKVPVPYPVQIMGTEVLLEFIGDADGTAAPRLAETRPGGKELSSLWDQLVGVLTTLARYGLAHGDLSAYNLLVHRGRLVMIDLPQVVDIIAHPNGRGFLTRDARNVAAWFAAHGLPDADPEKLARLLAEEARLA